MALKAACHLSYDITMQFSNDKAYSNMNIPDIIASW